MQLFSLPTELFELILHDAIIARGLKRALRLRLVNTTFAKAVFSALYTFKLLEHLLEYDSPQNPTEVPLSMLGPYLAHRVIHEPPNGNPILVCIRQIAVEIHKSDDPGTIKLPTVDEYVKLLCSSMNSYHSSPELLRGAQVPCERELSPTARFMEIFRRGHPGNVTDTEYESYLYAAAIRTNCLKLIQSCIDRDTRLLDTTVSCRREANLILGDYFIIAAHYANKTVLEYLLTAGTDTLNQYFRRDVFVEAAQAGRADIASFLYHFMLDEFPWQFLTPDATHAQATMWLRFTSDLDMLKFAETLSPEPAPIVKEYSLSYALQAAAAAGRLDTVTYLIQHDVPATGLTVLPAKYKFSWSSCWDWVRSKKPPRNDPVRMAAEEGHAPIVYFLLQHGASASVAMSSAAEHGHAHIVQTLLTTYPGSEDALLKSVMGGYTVTARMLLNNGVDANGGLEERVALAKASTIGEKSPLVYAIEKENTTLFKLLIQQGASLNLLGTAEECVKQAKNNGLDSMLVLLEDFSI